MSKLSILKASESGTFQMQERIVAKRQDAAHTGESSSRHFWTAGLGSLEKRLAPSHASLQIPARIAAKLAHIPAFAGE